VSFTSGANRFPNNFFDTIEVQSQNPDFDINLADHCAFTIPEDGFYMFSVRIENNTSMTVADQSMALRLFRWDAGSSTAINHASGQWHSIKTADADHWIQPAMATVFYATAGQIFFPGYNSSFTMSVQGGGAGAWSYMAVTKVG
jgi:hypothetical protein